MLVENIFPPNCYPSLLRPLPSPVFRFSYYRFVCNFSLFPFDNDVIAWIYLREKRKRNGEIKKREDNELRVILSFRYFRLVIARDISPIFRRSCHHQIFAPIIYCSLSINRDFGIPNITSAFLNLPSRLSYNFLRTIDSIDEELYFWRDEIETRKIVERDPDISAPSSFTIFSIPTSPFPIRENLNFQATFELWNITDR